MTSMQQGDLMPRGFPTAGVLNLLHSIAASRLGT